jgi:thiol-disulfide isomerase/thioredoxin
VKRRGYLLVAVGLVAVAVLAVVVANSTEPSELGGGRDINSTGDLPVIQKGPQPSLELGNGFTNTKRLTKADLEDKVVVYDFWTYSCVNCVRTLPYLEAWHQRYAKDGLVLVGVHSPEFDFEKIHNNVTAAVKRLKVTYPVVFDDEMAIWKAFHNQYWPAKYITDRQGDVRYVHFGEGEYAQTETVIRLLLGVADDAPRAADPKLKEPSPGLINTPETYLGNERGSTSSPQELADGEHRFTVPKEIPRNTFALEGDWLVAGQFVESTDAHENLFLRYHAREVNLVFDRTRKNPTYAVIELDGQPVPKSAWGASIVERDGQTVVDIDAADMYRLIANGPEGDHTLTVHPGGAGVQLFAFTFGS